LEAVSSEKLYGRYSQLLARAVLLAREWGYNLSEALSYLAGSIRETAFREVVQRLAATIRLGADLEKFLDSEYDTLFHEYEYHYQRMMNNLRVLLGVYVSVMAALVFAISSFTLLEFFFGGSAGVLVKTYVVSLASVTALGAIIILLLPREYFEVKGRESRENRLVFLIDTLAAAGALLGAAAAALYLHGRPVNAKTLGIALILAGAPTLPAGLLALRYESYVQDIDVFFPVFIRSLGSFIATIPSLKEAIRQVLRADLGKLTKLLLRFRARLENEVPPRIAWRRFSIECGSELVRRGSRIFQDTVDYGGDTVLAGKLVSDHNNALLRLRRLRAQVSSNFTSTAIIVHASVVAISIFILGLTGYFNALLHKLAGQLPGSVAPMMIVSPVNMEFVSRAIYVFTGALAIINAYLISIVRPYSTRGFWLFYAVLLLVTGATSYLSDTILYYVLKTMTGLPQIPIPTS